MVEECGLRSKTFLDARFQGLREVGCGEPTNIDAPPRPTILIRKGRGHSRFLFLVFRLLGGGPSYADKRTRPREINGEGRGLRAKAFFLAVFRGR